MLVILLPSVLLFCYARLLRPRCGARLGWHHPRDGPSSSSARALTSGAGSFSSAAAGGEAGGKVVSRHAYATAADLDLLASCLQAGLSTASACQVVADISKQPVWQQTAVMLRSGLAAEQAWQPMRGIAGLEDVAVCMSTSQQSGTSLKDNISNIAQQLRQQAQADASAQAQRVNVLIALPLTLCYLPAFLLLGLLPVVAGLGMQVFGYQ